MSSEICPHINRKQAVLSAAVAAAIASSGVAQAQQETRSIEEVVVTATKRPESLQDVPIAVTALTSDNLDQLGITNFSDYLIELPGVSAGGSGPGQNTIYIRGVASTTPNLTTAGVAGLAPNVSLYLDEQPLAQPGRNLDVYAADLQRVETLSGPQGTLFGASSQAGTIRLITNKPDYSGTYGTVKLGTSFTKDGEMSNNTTGVLNLPVSDNFALRGVVYVDNKGGYIDNVAGTIDASESARFREAGTVRANGEPVSVRRSGVQSQSGIDAAIAAGDTSVGQRIADFSNVTFLEANNSGILAEDFNETTYAGGRLTARWDINDDWNLLVAHSRQDIDSEGVFFADPNLGDLEIQRYEQDSIEDKFHNTNWTLTALFGELEVLYTGAFTDRETTQRVDYTDYLFVGQYLPYYICDSTVSYPEYNNYYTGYTDGLPQGTCQPPNLFVNSITNTEVVTHELRFSTDAAKRIRATAGVFYRDLQLEERNDFTYPGSVEAIVFGSAPFPDNFPQTTGYFSDPGPFPTDVMFRNDVQRTDEQLGFFGEVTFDVSDQFAVTLGARTYEIDVDFEGSANAAFCNGFQPDVNRFGTDITDLYNADSAFTFIGDCTSGGGITFSEGQTFDEIKAILTDADSFSIGRGDVVCAPNAICDAEIQGIVNALSAPDKATAKGEIFKVTLNWTPNENHMIYATWSEGFRPGLLNRPGGAVGPNNFTVPFELETDEVTNIELGWKSNFLDNTLRFNGSIFQIDIEKLQTTIFDPSITNLFFSDNAADAEVSGIEGDLVWLPEFSNGLTVNAAFSFIDSKITSVLTPTNDVRRGDELAFAPGFQGNIRARYEWQMSGSGLTAHVMPRVAFSSKSFSDIITINRDQIDSWTMVGLTAGVTGDTWSAELFIDNLTDERAEMSRNFVFDRTRVTYARPLTGGVRVTLDF